MKKQNICILLLVVAFNQPLAGMFSCCTSSRHHEDDYGQDNVVDEVKQPAMKDEQTQTEEMGVTRYKSNQELYLEDIFEKIPADALKVILIFLDLPSVLQLSRACHRMFHCVPANLTEIRFDRISDHHKGFNGENLIGLVGLLYGRLDPSRITTLDLRGVNVTSNTTRILALTFPSLRVLRVADRLIIHNTGFIREKDLAAITHACSHLELIDFNCPIFDDSWHRINIGDDLAQLTHLERLRLGSTEYSDQCIKSLTKSPSLKILSLEFSQSSYAFSTYRRTNESLLKGLLIEELTIRSYDFPNEALQQLSYCPNLRRLCLLECSEITREGLQSFLQNAYTLKQLEINECKEISETDIENIQLMFRHIAITFVPCQRHPWNLGPTPYNFP